MEWIENDILKLKIGYRGAEMLSLTDKRDGTELLWQADPAYWGWHAPMLFPVVGRCLNDQLWIDGKAFPMEKHGFARKSDFQLADHEGHRITFRLWSNSETLKIYPYPFELLVGYGLNEDRITVSYEVRNTGTQTMYFALGGHPAFRVPWNEGEMFSDYYLKMEQNEPLDRSFINEEGFFTGETQTLGMQEISLHEQLFEKDALIFKHLRSSQLHLCSRKNSRQLEFEFSDYPYLGIWTKPGAPYLCLEPWQGCADTADRVTAIEAREGIISLEAGKTANRKFSFRVIY